MIESPIPGWSAIQWRDIVPGAQTGRRGGAGPVGGLLGGKDPTGRLAFRIPAPVRRRLHDLHLKVAEALRRRLGGDVLPLRWAGHGDGPQADVRVEPERAGRVGR